MAQKVNMEQMKKAVLGLPGVLAAKKADLAKLERKKKDIEEQHKRLILLDATLEGGIASLKDSIETLEKLISDCGLEDLAVETVASSGQEEVKQEAVVSKEFKERREAGKRCCFRGQKENGELKWCERTLRTKPQKAEGFCSVHFDMCLGKSEAAWKKENAPKKRKKAK